MFELLILHHWYFSQNKMLRLIFPLLANAAEETAATTTSPPEKPNLRRHLGKPVVSEIKPHTQIGMLVNALNDKVGGNLISQFQNVGLGVNSKLLLPTLKNDESGCVVEHKFGAARQNYSSKTVEGVEAISEMMANEIGISGGYGPVKASISVGWKSERREEKYHFASMQVGSTYSRQKQYDLNCVRSKAKTVFNQEVIDQMKPYLDAIKKAKYPGVGNEKNWKNHMNLFKKFTDAFGTHVKTKSIYGALAIQMYNMDTSSKEEAESYTVKLKVALKKLDSEVALKNSFSTSSSSSSTDSKITDAWLKIGVDSTKEFDWHNVAIDKTGDDEIQHIIKEELTDIHIILRDHPDMKEYHKELKGLARYIHGYSNGPLCRCDNKVNAYNIGNCHRLGEDGNALDRYDSLTYTGEHKVKDSKRNKIASPRNFCYVADFHMLDGYDDKEWQVPGVGSLTGCETKQEVEKWETAGSKEEWEKKLPPNLKKMWKEEFYRAGNFDDSGSPLGEFHSLSAYACRPWILASQKQDYTTVSNENPVRPLRWICYDHSQCTNSKFCEDTYGEAEKHGQCLPRRGSDLDSSKNKCQEVGGSGNISWAKNGGFFSNKCKENYKCYYGWGTWGDQPGQWFCLEHTKENNNRYTK